LRAALPAGKHPRVRVTEIFHSIQGESTLAGVPTVFVRFTGCDLRCQYCDTEYAFYGGRQMSREEILAEVAKYPARFVCLTGGEPTLQKELPQLAQEGIVFPRREQWTAAQKQWIREYFFRELLPVLTPIGSDPSSVPTHPLSSPATVTGTNTPPSRRSAGGRFSATTAGGR